MILLVIALVAGLAAEQMGTTDKQAFLAHGISSAMMWTIVAFGVAAAWLIGLFVVTVRGAGTTRVPRG